MDVLSEILAFLQQHFKVTHVYDITHVGVSRFNGDPLLVAVLSDYDGEFSESYRNQSGLYYELVGLLRTIYPKAGIGFTGPGAHILMLNGEHPDIDLRGSHLIYPEEPDGDWEWEA